MVQETVREFRRWFWRPPRAHGEVLHDRRVSSLELLYDLVYVAVISQAASQLAADISGPRFLEFAIVFGLIWIAWVNGSTSSGAGFPDMRAGPLPSGSSPISRSRSRLWPREPRWSA